MMNDQSSSSRLNKDILEQAFNVLFVDDEPFILSGLKRSLRPMREQWQMAFAGSGEEAISLMADRKFDVIVSDIRMPGMNGVELLSEVKNRHPHVIRIALSGHAETEMELECVQAAHQFLAKPADVDQILSAVNSTLMLKFYLEDEGLQSLAVSIDSLPSLPSLYQQILAEVASPNGTILKAGEIISEDIAMSAKILQLVNSAFFGLSKEVDSIAQAASILGFDILKSLVLCQKVFSSFENTRQGGLDIELMTTDSQRIGILARKIATVEGLSKKIGDNAMMAGMLSRIGRLILADRFPTSYRKVMSELESTDLSPREAEMAQFGASHESVGGYLLGIWGLPSNIVEAVTFQNTPWGSGSSDFNTLSCVYFANLLLRFEDDERCKQEMLEGGESAYPKEAPSEDRVDAWLALRNELENEH